ncbi:MAG: hypothetical protein LBP76_13560 [Treponema sp.]|jgi:hypothetical protein|nr:hypothetical protein [Treponema sp.]
MMKSYTKAVVAVLFLSLTGALFAEGYDTPIKPFTLPSARIHGYGGPHAAYTDDINTLFVNPAALRTAKQISVLDLAFGTTGDVIGLGKVATDMLKSDDDLDYTTIGEFAEKTGGKLPLGVSAPGLALGYVGHGFGFGLFSREYVDAEVVGMNVKAAANIDVVLNGGYSFRLINTETHILDVGVAAKVFGRYGLERADNFLNIADHADAILEEVMDGATTYIGGGLDLGTTYTLGKFKAALVYNDVFSPAAVKRTTGDTWGVVESKMNIGLSYQVFGGKSIKLAAMADYRDIFNLFKQKDYRSRNPWLNLGIGVEAEFFNIISVQVGMNDMLPAAGIGFDLFIFEFVASIYGKELGNDPGVLSTYGLDAGILFRY